MIPRNYPENTHARNGVQASELASATWQKSSRSQGVSNCVEFAALSAGRVAVRNSRHPDGPALIYTRAEIAALLAGAKDGEFDHLVA